MGGLLRLAEGLLALGRFTSGLGAALRRGSIALVCLLIAALLSVAAMGCGVAALWIYLLPLLGPVGAPLVAAGALLVIALVLLLVARSVLDARPRHAPGPPDGAAAAADLSRLVKEHKLEMLLAALTAGLVAGAPAAPKSDRPK
ncbi:MAG TPA: hypothetical protein VHT04_06230 [Stellaceae bacterium]|nr:hypothetical protein [Stellaceae bacterium]